MKDEDTPGLATDGNSNSTNEGINLGFHGTAQDYTDHGNYPPTVAPMAVH